MNKEIMKKIENKMENNMKGEALENTATQNMDVNNIKRDVMSKIEKGNIKMLPKVYFIFGQIFLLLSFITGIIVTSTFFALLFFRIEQEKPFSLNHLGWLLRIPWEYGFIATVFLLISLFLIKKSERVYKIDFKTIIFVLLISSVIAGFIIKEITPTRNLMRRLPYNRRDTPIQRNFPNNPRYERKNLPL